MTSVRARGLRTIGGLLLAATITGCASLPASGPTGHEIEAGARARAGEAAFDIVPLDAQAMTRLRAAGAAGTAGPGLASLAREASNDIIGVGDVLSVSLYEVGVGLFSGGRIGPDGFDPSARAEQFPIVVVARDGSIKLPYIGQVAAAGRTTAEVQAEIERSYHGRSQQPQVLVAIKQNNSEVVYVSGEVRKPGRLELTLQRERLLDAIASAGGGSVPAQDLVVRVTRDNRTVEDRLGDIGAGSPDDLVLIAGDRIEVSRQPRSFVVLGAPNRVAQIAFEQSRVSLAEAIARAGGPNDSTADPTAVFLFRDNGAPDGSEPRQRPVIYRLDLMQPASYFVSQQFLMRDKDVIYIGNARANRPSKFVSIVNQLFAPFVSAAVVTRK